VYLDNAATTPLDPRVLDAMLPYMRGSFGNPSATYSLAREAGAAVERARKSIASILGVRPREIVFTAGGTESINAAIKGVALAQQAARRGNHIVTSTIEHHAVLHTCQYLERFGFEVTYVPVDALCRIDPDDVSRAITGQTILVTLMAANNEVGTIEPIADIARAVAQRAAELERKIPFHTDAVQAANSIALDALIPGVDLLSLAAHKFRGPKGSGVLYLRRGTPFLPQLSGGGQERQRRAGTENVAAIVGTAAALKLTQDTLDADRSRLAGLSLQLTNEILRTIPGTALNGDPEHRLANNVSITFDGADAGELLAALDSCGIACSAGAVCGATTMEPSHVLLAMGIPLERAVSTIRFSPGHDTTTADIDHVLRVLPPIVERVRSETLARAR
jgi:cysteine desulfurase